MAEITVLILGDVHFASQPGRRAEVEGVPLRLGAELVERAIVDACRRSSFDAVAMMGDLVDDGSAAGAEADLAELAAVLGDLAGGVPHIVIPGNHDGPAAESLLAAFGDRPGLHEVKGYRFFSFADSWDENDVGHRSAEAMRRLAEEAARPAAGPLIVLQHNCVYPPIDDEYPYVFADPEPIMAGYRRGEVLLSLNGHYHAGQPLCAEGGVQYYTAPSVHRSPFRYALCRLDGRCVSIEEHCLKLPDSPPLYDAHSHTQYA
ncbi:MAG: metallophosphoesterase, partial [Candidatus Brocadiia bacterium]|nr:metallophosphoesterase [Candidatus Brocadiia bacterium]